MADGFYTNDDADHGSFGGYGCDGAETDETLDTSDSGYADRSAGADRESGAGGYCREPAWRFRMFRRVDRAGGSGRYGRAA